MGVSGKRWLAQSTVALINGKNRKGPCPAPVSGGVKAVLVMRGLVALGGGAERIGAPVDGHSQPGRTRPEHMKAPHARSLQAAVADGRVEARDDADATVPS